MIRCSYCGKLDNCELVTVKQGPLPNIMVDGDGYDSPPKPQQLCTACLKWLLTLPKITITKYKEK